MDMQDLVALSLVGGAIFLISYAIKRNFDENALYIQQGYHQTVSTNSVWVK